MSYNYLEFARRQEKWRGGGGRRRESNTPVLNCDVLPLRLQILTLQKFHTQRCGMDLTVKETNLHSTHFSGKAATETEAM